MCTFRLTGKRYDRLILSYFLAKDFIHWNYVVYMPKYIIMRSKWQYGLVRLKGDSMVVFIQRGC